jgi:hypothetical protein
MTSTLPFADISTHPEKINTSSILARISEILGFRYYWATEGLTESDLQYAPGNENRNLYQTLNHLYNMIDFVGATLEDNTYPFPEKDHGFTLTELRTKTLERIDQIKEFSLNIKGDILAEKSVKLSVEGNPMEFNIWHVLNPFMDAIFHTGQIVSFRRANGNPIDPSVQPFFGKRIM